VSQARGGAFLKVHNAVAEQSPDAVKKPIDESKMHAMLGMVIGDARKIDAGQDERVQEDEEQGKKSQDNEEDDDHDDDDDGSEQAVNETGEVMKETAEKPQTNSSDGTHTLAADEKSQSQVKVEEQGSAKCYRISEVSGTALLLRFR
jgi:hypothetical protein